MNIEVFATGLAALAVSFESYFKRRCKQQTTVSPVVEVGAQKADAVCAAIKAAGGKVL